MKLTFCAALLALAAPLALASDGPRDYSHTVALAISGKAPVLQLPLPQAVYLHARDPALKDLRVFDAAGISMPYTLLAPASRSQTSRKDLPVKVFPVMASAQKGPSLDSELEVRRSPDGAVLSVATRASAGNAAPGLAALVLDLGPAQQPVDALRLVLPAGTSNYHARVALEVSDDLKRWETVGDTDVSWLVNQQTEALSNDRIEFEPRTFRYARLTWREGTPLRFERVMAEAPLRTDEQVAQEKLVLDGAPGRFEHDLVYKAAPAIPVQRIGLQFGAQNVVLPAQLGRYVELADPRGSGKTRWEFEPVLEATFYRLDQNGKVRASGDIGITAEHVAEWVLRPQGPVGARPQLRLGWTPSTLVFLASGQAPYSLAFGRPDAKSARRELSQVAPGFDAAEVAALEVAVPGTVQAQGGPAPDPASEAQKAGSAARQRVLILWAVLLAGVALLGYMAWRLIRQMR